MLTKINRVLEFQADPNQSIIVGKVKLSMRNDLYEVELLVNNNITDSKCSCPRGTVICHHIAALDLYAHYILSSIDKACLWSVRKNNSSIGIKTINQIHSNIDFTDTIVAETDINIFIEELTNLTVPVG